MAEHRYLGKNQPRLAARDIVTGRARYAADEKIAGMLWAKVLRSPYAYAKIIDIDTSKAEALPGVKAIITYKNAPHWKAGMIIPHKHLLSDTVYFIGDAVALIAAETEAIADEARDLIKVEYEELDPILSIEDSMKEDAPQLYPEIPGNVADYEPFANQGMALTQEKVGDIEAGFAEADVIHEVTTVLENAQNPLPPESPGIIAEWNGEDYVTVRGSMSSNGLCRMMNSGCMNLPISKMRVIASYVGGSYGSKHFSSNGLIIHYAAALSKATGKPVGLFYDREEHLTCQTTRMNSIGKYKIGMKKDGTITAIQGEWTGEAGAFNGEHYMIIAVGLISQGVLAQSKNVDISTKIVLTNRQTSGAFRGYGYLENAIHISNALYQTLEKIDLDPVEYFRRNRLKVGDEFYHAYMCSGMVKAAGPDALEMINKGAEKFRWDERWKGFGVPTYEDENVVRAVGVGFCGQSDVGEQLANENVNLTFDGGVTVSCVATEFGPGTRDVMRKIAAEALNVDLSMVRVTDSDSMAAPYEWGSTGSRSTYAMGTAVLKACEDAKRQLFERVAQIFHCPPEALETKDGMVSIIGHPEATVPWIAAIGFNGSITGVGNFGGEYNVLVQQVQFIEMELDKKTGKVTVLEQLCSTDCGQIVNPDALKGQLDGYFPGIDMAIREGMIWDKDGRIVNPNMIDYKTRTWNEIPKHENIILESAADGNYVGTKPPYGAFGAGEPSLAPGIPALTLAIYNATGKWFTTYPITPKEILDALREKEGR
ncbi:MAG: xanthine dehydrogenase family protein molybdopterin-binding subunit [Mogibacterium sp.]|nr:xanthine dehydrogenase family protein molybdopterin-binding subunit [Mogibacterium sp.]